MVALLRAFDNQNQPIVDAANPVLKRTHFNLLDLQAGEQARTCLADFETVHVLQSGTAEIAVDGTSFGVIGGRVDIWSGPADSVYAPPGAEVTLRATSRARIAVAGGRTAARFGPFRIRPEEVDMVEVGSAETHSRRRIFHILGRNGEGRSGNLLVSELYADPGCWSGYPPHKHDEDRTGETAHEELYHYRYRPPTGFGAQIGYDTTGTAQAFMTRDGDCFLLDGGYHPTVTAPGFEGYLFTILVGETARGLVQHFDETHAHLTAVIPGLQAMRDKFK